MMHDPYLIYVLFGYGIALFAMGLAISLEIRRDTTLPLARSLRWLAGFGFVYAGAEWLEMLTLISHNGVALPAYDLTSYLYLPLLVASGFLLSQFGASLLADGKPKLDWVSWIPLLLLPLWLFSLWLASGFLWYTEEMVHIAAVTARYVLYLPGVILSGLALLSQRSAFKAMGLPQLARNCTWGAIVFGLQGIMAGIVVPPAGFFPANIVNSTTFQNLVGLPPQIFRAFVAVGITFFVLRVLRLFKEQQHLELEFVSFQLKQLSIQALNAQEEERKRIARELHDDTAQLLSTLLLQLKLLDRAKGMDEIRAKNSHLIELVAETIQGVRRMALELRPAALEDLGLATAVRWYAQELATKRGLTVEVNSTGLHDRMPPQVELALYRVVQEALINAAKHSRASKANVMLEQTNGIVRVLVSDNGDGFDVDQVAHDRGKGLGLFGMRERISLLDGTLHIDSQHRQGTTVIVEVPLVGKVGVD
ncbi:MAG: sensor histidine kinase [Dehalococcoidia bacterium]|nr:sensor histidine kinase [Dehalococcoidia bacterium]